MNARRPRPWRLGAALTAGLALGALLVACTRSGPPRALPADPAEPILYVALGDSTVEGVGATSPERNYVSQLHARLRQRYPNARVENLGVAGATSADVARDQLPRAVALAPHLITLSVGPNDITNGVGTSALERNIDTILATLARETRAVIAVNLLPDLAVTRRFNGGPVQHQVARLTAQVNEMLREKAEEHGVTLVDLYGPSREEVPRRPELLASDGYHPSDAGYARWAELMWQALEPRIVR